MDTKEKQNIIESFNAQTDDLYKRIKEILIETYKENPNNFVEYLTAEQFADENIKIIKTKHY